VMNIEHHFFEARLSYEKQKRNAIYDWELPIEALQDLIVDYKQIISKHSSDELPQDVNKQLKNAIKAVFKSWYCQRAIKYRSINNIPDDWGTAVNVQSMVFGNLNSDSATGVLFTRDPSNGDKRIFGEFLSNAQGEDLVAGIRNPHQITEHFRIMANDSQPSLEVTMPETFKQLTVIAAKLEHHFKDMQDIEFTIQNKQLWLLQTRSGKRSAEAAIKIVTDMVEEGLITKYDAIQRIKPNDIERLLHNTIDESVKIDLLTRGLPASPGAVSGVVVFSSEEAEEISKKFDVILVRRETSPEDIGGINAAVGLLTVKGGMTSHAAVVARGMGKPCVCGADGIVIDESDSFMMIDVVKVNAGYTITINGATGDVIQGAVTTIKQQITPAFNKLMSFIDSKSDISVRANAETEKDVEIANSFGAVGIGLCRTEHMFFAPERIAVVREMIVAETKEERLRALEKIAPFQKQDFKAIFKSMNGLPVTIRLLDPPLHEFLPLSDKDKDLFAKQMNMSVSDINARIKKLSETNPMIGHRGSRLAITFPEIYEMQVRCIFEAAQEIGLEYGLVIKPEIMAPFIFGTAEVRYLKDLVASVHDDIHSDIEYSFGVMIELPRAALQAGEIAKLVDFCSFGTNDLTQTAMGISRDDAGKFLSAYRGHNIIESDPFVSIDQIGVGELVKIAVERIRAANPKVKIGICGEHGGDPESIRFFCGLSMDYVSCSPYRIPIARLTVAQMLFKARSS